MVTKREWLVERGLAKAGARGRFSREANAALAKAISEGIVFDEPVVKPVSENKEKKVRAAKKPVAKAPSSELYDAKEVRRWAEANGKVEKGKRGRLPTEVIQEFLSSGEAAPKKKRVVQVRDKVREQSVAWTFAKRRENEDPRVFSEPLVAVTNCGECRDTIAYCKGHGDEGLPMAPAYLGGQPLMLDRPAS